VYLDTWLHGYMINHTSRLLELKGIFNAKTPELLSAD
jgi:hypothetical protein